MDPTTRLEILDTADIPDSNDKVGLTFGWNKLRFSNLLRPGWFLARVQISRS